MAGQWRLGHETYPLAALGTTAQARPASMLLDPGISGFPKEDWMFGSRIALDKALFAKVKRYADLAGYSSVDEFVTHVLEKEIAHLEDAASPEEIKKRLKGLGYIS